MGLLPEVYYDFKFSEAREKLYHEIMMEEVTDKEVKRYNSETVVEEKQIRYQIALKKYTDILNRMVDDN